jgi:hypothetical protein
MKRFGLFVIVVLVFGLVGATRSNASSNLIVNGSFENPNVGTGWSAFSSIPGWNTNGNGIEIDYSPVVGGPAYDGNQSLEVNYDYPENVYQTVTGLTPGQTYLLSWAYGDRPGSGNEQLDVTFGGNVVATDYDNLDGSNSTLLWFPNSVVVTATGTSEVLSFNGMYPNEVYDNGGLSYGNEVDAVSLTSAVPEPASLPLFLTGFGLLGVVAWRRRDLLAASNL